MKTLDEQLGEIKRALADKETRDRLIGYIKETPMTDKERMIVTYRLGLDDATPKTLAETGKMFGYTRERIRQIEGKAISKMKAYYGLE